MHINKKTRYQLSLQNAIFTITLLSVAGLTAWVSTQYAMVNDWTASQRNSLSRSSILLLEELDEPVQITAFARQNNLLKNQVNDIVSRYQRNKDDITLQFVNPDAEPDRIRELGITHEGELMIAYKGRSEKVSQLSEQSITNVLTSLARQQANILFLIGHGEREPQSEANYALGNFGTILEQKGLSLQTLNLAASPEIAATTQLLVLASPQTPLLPGEVDLILRYLKQGGNLLWLVEPGEIAGLEKLSDYLSIEFLTGTIVDATTQKFGIDNPAFILIPEYPPHAVTTSMDSLTLFPESVALQITNTDNWTAKPFLTTLARTWTESGSLVNEVSYDANTSEQAGPFDIGIALVRKHSESIDAVSAPDSEQRIIVIGDGDFLANSYLGNAGNLDLGLNIFNWLSQNDNLIKIPARVEKDTQLELGNVAQTIIAFGFLFGLPLILLSSGLFIGWKRRRL